MKSGQPTTGRLFALSFVLLVGACSDNGAPIVPEVGLIKGTWVLERSYFAALVIHVYLPPPGSITLDTYSPSGVYTRVKDGEVLMTARYIVTNEDSRLFLKYENVQTANGFQYQEPKYMWVGVAGDTLRVNGYSGGDVTFGHVFARAR